MSHKVIIDKVVKKYGDVLAVNEISVEIEKGEFFTLLGPSGCGKTTLLRMIAGFNSIDGGEIYFDDECINDLPPHKRNIGMVFQNYAVFPHMTVEKNIAYGLKARNIKEPEFSERIEEVLKLMHIEKYRDRSPQQLSGGQQQRVALARAIVIRPGLLLMDEPLSNLDAKLRLQMRSAIRKIQRELGITTIYVTHDQEEALAISDRIAVMKDGVIEQLGIPSSIYHKPENTFISDFIGTSNFIEANYADGKIDMPGNLQIPMQMKKEYNGSIIIAARPEHIYIEEPQPNALLAEIELVTFLGDYVNYEVKLRTGQIIEINEYSDKIRELKKPGDRVSLRMALEKISIFDKTGKESLV